MNYDWSWQVFFQTSPDGVHTYLQTLIIGTGWSLLLAGCAWVLSFTLGATLGVARTVRSPRWNTVGTVYVELFRNVPLLVQMFLWYFVLPELLPVGAGTAMKQMPQPWAQFIPAVLCLGLYGAARVAEQVCSGIKSISKGQFYAATAIGLTSRQAYIHVVLPQAFRVSIPMLTSEMMSTVKYSSVALTIGLLELTGAARSMQEFSYHIFEAFSAATVIYIIVNGVVVICMRLLEMRLKIPGLAVSTKKINLLTVG
jgi:glutamate/aspartate transport system permease protein